MWQINDDFIVLHSKALHAQLNRNSPTGGIHISHVLDQAIHCSLFALIQPQFQDTAESDIYVRGQDLFVSFPYHETAGLKASAYWTFGSFEGLPTLEFVLSVETHRLETDSGLIIESSFSNAHLADFGIGEPSTSVIRLEPQIDLAIITQPSDFAERTTSSSDGRLVMREPLLGPALEKGVIRRARIAMIALPHGQTTEAIGYQRQIASSIPPLTT